jgi:hypothetical protein
MFLCNAHGQQAISLLGYELLEAGALATSTSSGVCPNGHNLCPSWLTFVGSVTLDVFMLWRYKAKKIGAQDLP